MATKQQQKSNYEGGREYGGGCGIKRGPEEFQGRDKIRISLL
jgi:hypothetical protein